MSARRNPNVHSKDSFLLGREVNLDRLVSGKDECVLGDVEVRGVVGTVQDLNESGDIRGEVGDVVDVPLSLAGGLVSIVSARSRIEYEAIDAYHDEVEGNVDIGNGRLQIQCI